MVYVLADIAIVGAPPDVRERDTLFAAGDVLVAMVTTTDLERLELLLAPQR